MSLEYLARRLLQSILVLIGVMTLVFFLIRLGPGDPVIRMAGPNASQEEIQNTRRRLGLDRPIYIQYVYYLRNVVHGDLGDSFRQHRPAAELVLERLPATAELALAAMVLAGAVSIPLGVMAALNRGKAQDFAALILSLTGQSMPSFWLGILLIMVFAVRLHILPTSGYGSWRHLILPAFTLAFYIMGLLTRMTRSSLLEVLDADYVRVARAKGLAERHVLARHALRNALIPVVTVIGLQTGTLLGGAVITEAVFAWPGVGMLAVSSISNLDYAVVQAIVVLSGIVFVVVNFVLDVLYVIMDPRIRMA